MPRFILLAVGLLVVLFAGLSDVAAQQPKPAPATASWHAEGKNGAVCVGGSEARDASLAMLKSGGNAADAAVTATLIISVTSSVVCFGGEGPILYYDPTTSSVEVYCGQGAAPAWQPRRILATKAASPAKASSRRRCQASWTACLPC